MDSTSSKRFSSHLKPVDMFLTANSFRKDNLYRLPGYFTSKKMHFKNVFEDWLFRSWNTLFFQKHCDSWVPRRMYKSLIQEPTNITEESGIKKGSPPIFYIKRKILENCSPSYYHLLPLSILWVLSQDPLLSPVLTASVHFQPVQLLP